LSEHEQTSDPAGASGTPEPADETSRRNLLSTATTVAVGAGLAASYGTFFFYAGRYLYPASDTETAWLFVARTEDLDRAGSIEYRAPSGATIVVAAKGRGEYLALSSVCPHLGCQVHWEAQNERFFCPCHNGVFDADGQGTEGPPKGQSLLRYPLKVENGLLYIEVPVESLDVARLDKPGHDGCLRSRTDA